MDDRSFVTLDDVKSVAPALLQHRVLPRSSVPRAAAQAVDATLSSVPVPL